MDLQRKEWDRQYLNYGQKKPNYDDWLDKYQTYLDASAKIPIIDLGCGPGNDTLYLKERGYPVISCDYSQEALNLLKSFIKDPDTRFFDMLDGLPFTSSAAKAIIADLSIHYFSWADTQKLVHEISRVLTQGGYLFIRVNSIKDVNHGAGQGVLIEDNFYDINGKFKRFFNEEQLRMLFENWNFLFIKEYEMTRYPKPKMVWEAALQNTKNQFPHL